MHKFLLSMVWFCALLGSAHGEIPTTAEALNQQVKTILRTHQVPGAAIGVIHPDGQVDQWLYGYRDAEYRQPVERQTMFRVGSVAKMFVALAVMKLVEQGEVQLQDKLSELAPEIEFFNPWEAEHPVRLVHLLEHSAGWDAPHFAEKWQNFADPISAGAALALHPHSRTSRWVPGSRVAYNNTGPVVAAYLVEKMTAKPFEQVVNEWFFQPLGMTHSSYFYSEQFREHGTKLYVKGQPVPYRHLNFRAAGGLNANLDDMLSFTRKLLEPAEGDEASLLSLASLQQMEKPHSTAAARAGLEIGWGLGNLANRQGHSLFNGHQGALRGAQAAVAYSRSLGVGFVILMNTNSPAFERLYRLLSAYLGSKHSPQQIPSLDKGLGNLSGFYRPVNPIAEQIRAFTKLMMVRVVQNEQNLWIKPILGGQPRRLLQSGPSQFVQTETGRVALVTTQDPILGQVVHYGSQTLSRVNTMEAMFYLVMTPLWILLVLSSLPVAAYLVLRQRKLSYGAGQRLMSLVWPLAASLTLLLLVSLIMSISGSPQADLLLGTVSWQSLSLTALTLLFAVLTVLAAYGQWMKLKGTPWHWRHLYGQVMVVMHFGALLYLMLHGLIGLRTWAM